MIALADLPPDIHADIPGSAVCASGWAHLFGMALSVRSPDELIAAIPHMLGFQPKESIVVVPIRSDLPTARIDLPSTPRAQELAWRSMREGMSRYARPGAAVGIVCFTTNRQQADRVSREFAERLDTIGIDTHLFLWVDETRWADLVTGDMGLQTAEARERVATMTVLAGRPQPAATRDSLAQSLVGNRDPVARLLTETRANTAERTVQIESRWAVSRVQQFHRDGVRLDDADAARLLVAVEAIPTRDRLWLAMDRGNAVSHVALWTDMTKRAPDEVRTAPASLLAFGSWLSGDGAMAWCALDQVPDGKPYALANLVAAAIESGMHPREWEAAKSMPEHDMDLAAAPARPQGRQLGSNRPAHEL